MTGCYVLYFVGVVAHIRNMYQSAYQSLQTIGKAPGPYVGGICRWWYTPIQNILIFPAVDPVTQMLSAEPELKDGAQWYGPVSIPDKSLGWEQEQKENKAGTYYTQKVEGFIPGNEATNHINLRNLAFHQLCIIAKLRSGGFYIVLGNDVAGLKLIANTTTGTGTLETPGQKLLIGGESIEPAEIIPEFSLDVVQSAVANFILDSDGVEIVDFDEEPILYG